MDIEERGVVVGQGDGTALVRAHENPHCSGCAAAGSCRSGAGEERVVEALNEVGAREGDEVLMAIPSGALLKASFQVYMVPVLGVLAGAGAAQAVAGALAGPEAGGMAAGAGGLAGAVLAVAGTKLFRRRYPDSGALLPRITRIV
jgi:sigma-E factor negative regulatory protein RseC